MADSLRDQLRLELRGTPHLLTPVELAMLDLLDRRLANIEQSAGDANQTAANAYQFANEVKKELHKLKTKGESA